jgi:hypothetical protein
VIIVEGPDGAGKTTLIRQMQDRYGLRVAPRVVSKETTAMVNLQDWVENNLEEGPQWLLFDRHRLISETIYGPIVRGYAEDGFDSVTGMMLWMKRFYELEPLIIYCMPPLNVVRGNVRNDPDNKAVAWKIEAIYQAYAARAAIDDALSPGSTIIWDYTTDGRETDPLLTLDGRVEMMKRRTHA